MEPGTEVLHNSVGAWLEQNLVPDGAPGLRPHDRVRYYAAFVIDPDGNRIEAVTFPSE